MNYIKLVISLLVLIGILNSCATTAKYTAKVDTWVGADVNRLIASWGPPSDVYTMPNGNKMYIWLRVGSTVVISNYYSILKGTLTTSSTRWCKTTFTVNNLGKIIHWRVEGNSCKSY